jgi:CBS domain-containing protein
MKELKIGDLMLPVGDYASIHEDASILEGILALREAQQREFEDDPTRHRDRAVLVQDAHGEIIGKLSMWSIIGCLEPNYERVVGGAASSKAASRVGSARIMIGEMMESSHLWRNRLRTIADESAHLTIKDLLHAPRKKELIDEGASMEKAIHQLVAGHFMSLLVTREGRIVGILRLVDVFDAVSRMIRREHEQTTAGEGESGP